METQFRISEASLADAEEIAALFAISWVSPFSRLQFGETEPAQLVVSMVPQIVEQIAKTTSKFIVMRHLETTRVAAVAQWALPVETSWSRANVESAQDSAERQEFEDEAYKRSLPESSSKDLIMAFTLGLRRLREETLQGREHLLLENLATHPEHRGKGLASQLVQWAFPIADEQQLLVYLDTASDNPAARLYKKLGFEEQGRNIIKDLSLYAPLETIETVGCNVEHIHIAFIRFPKAFHNAIHA